MGCPGWKCEYDVLLDSDVVLRVGRVNNVCEVTGAANVKCRLTNNQMIHAMSDVHVSINASPNLNCLTRANV